MITLIQTFLIACTLFAVLGTALSFVRHPHWVFRIWDFPRAQLGGLAGASALAYGLFFHAGSGAELVMLALAALTAGWQLHKIRPYTPLAARQVEDAEEEHLLRDRGANRLTLLVSNVLMENEDHDRLLRTVRAYDPDLVLAVEVNMDWMLALDVLTATYPYVVRQPQENYYGMVLFSRYPLVDPEIKFLIQRDIPSIHTGVRLPSGVVVALHGIHPRPPEPIRDQISAPRDAELVVVGKAIREEDDRPTIVAGDLNDVAWSFTSELFLRLSGLLDPRVGRGLFATYDAKNPVMRYPLDHVFHSNDFRLAMLERLPSIGSDHFPILISLLYDPQAEAQQPEPERRPGDEREAAKKLEVSAKAAATGADRPNDD
jgi:endonuclease/exonuclease/phosphatase (EEP) superfamily protein YafD